MLPWIAEVVFYWPLPPFLSLALLFSLVLFPSLIIYLTLTLSLLFFSISGYTIWTVKSIIWCCGTSLPPPTMSSPIKSLPPRGLDTPPKSVLMESLTLALSFLLLIDIQYRICLVISNKSPQTLIVITLHDFSKQKDKLYKIQSKTIKQKIIYEEYYKYLWLRNQYGPLEWGISNINLQDISWGHTPIILISSISFYDNTWWGQNLNLKGKCCQLKGTLGDFPFSLKNNSFESLYLGLGQTWKKLDLQFFHDWFK